MYNYIIPLIGDVKLDELTPRLILLRLSNNKMITLPKRLDNIVYFANEFIVNDPRITALIPQRLKEQLELARASIKT